MCSTCHVDNEDGTWTGAVTGPDMDIDNLAQVTEHTEAGLAQYIADEMPDGNAGGCVGECASDIAAYMWSYRTPAPTNLVADGDFEAPGELAGWYTWEGNTVSKTTAESFSGTQSMLISDRTADGKAAYSLTDLVSAGNAYEVAAQVMITGTEAGTVRMVASIDCSSFEAIAYDWAANDEAVAPGTWTALSGNFEIPVDCGTLGPVQIYFEGTAAEIDVYVDDVSVVLDASAVTE